MEFQVEVVLRLTMQAMLVALYVSAPAVIVSAAVGLAVSFVQAVTSMQDPSIGAGIKLVAVTLTVFATATWGSSLIMSFAKSVLVAIFTSREYFQ